MLRHRWAWQGSSLELGVCEWARDGLAAGRYERRSGTTTRSPCGFAGARGLRLPSTRGSSRSDRGDGHRPRRLAYQTVPATQRTAPSTLSAAQ